jgi:hypothetical protein
MHHVNEWKTRIEGTEIKIERVMLAQEVKVKLDKGDWLLNLPNSCCDFHSPNQKKFFFQRATYTQI